ncbi:MAG: hypothetical protein K2H53_02560, partial [Clostridia bacterium]|nr:hypothetical protein [Clostridia bacterium]
IVFTYNGIQYEATKSPEATYNSPEWKVTSKGTETSIAQTVRNNYKTVNASSNAYTFEELEGLYIEIANFRWSRIKSGSWATWSDVENYLTTEAYKESSEIQEVRSKLKYIQSSQVTARAGYSGARPDGLYPHESLNGHFLIDLEGTNAKNNSAIFAGYDKQYLYPGQLQINLGLVTRDVTHLQLSTDIVNTTVSINGHDTEYVYGEKESSYHQYIYEEDYDYSKDASNITNKNGVAVYTEDNVEFYVTYESTIRNLKMTPTAMTKIKDYFNKEFTWAESYKTTKGYTINGIEVTLHNSNGETPLSAKATPIKNNLIASAYYYNDITIGETYISGSDYITVRITYKLVGNSDNAKQVLLDNLSRVEDGERKYSQTLTLEAENGTTVSGEISYAMVINHYAEITEYRTREGYIDRKSHPDNFSIAEYEAGIKKFQEAREAYNKVFKNNPNDSRLTELRLAAKLAEENLGVMLENDASTTILTLSNSGTERSLVGNVWEAIDATTASSLELQSEYGNRYVTYDGSKAEYKENVNIEGITVELVELEPVKDSNVNIATQQLTQAVRARTTTASDGSYEFSSYIAGDYAIRFVYGNEGNEISSNLTTNSYDETNEPGDADYLPINGQYYQSTKANPNTDSTTYWYYNNDKENRSDITLIDNNELFGNRYSDAYDDSYTRLTQMNATVVEGDNINGSTSSEYNYDGNIEVQTTRTTDPIYAYTSTMELEVEYVRTTATGNKDNSWYKYSVSNVDFGLTPRAYNDVNVSRYVSNIKLYTEGSTDPLINIDFDKNGERIITENTVGEGYVVGTLNQNAVYLDDLIHINYEQLIAQRAHLEITYSVIVSNDSKYDAENRIYDTIKYIKDANGKTISVVYYGENTQNLVNYETRKAVGSMIYHNAPNEENSASNIQNEERIGNNRLNTCVVNSSFSEGNIEKITSSAKSIVDYPTEPLDFAGKNYLDKDINENWVETKPDEFVSSRENYKIENGEIELLGVVGEEDSIMTTSHILKAKDESPLLQNLLPGESASDKLVLQHTLSTTVEDVSGDPSNTDLSGNDIEYSNLVEITRLSNTAGKIIDTEGYDITGEKDAETSRVRRIADLETTTETAKISDGTEVVAQVSEFEATVYDQSNKEKVVQLTPTLSTGKSQSTVIAPPAGLSKNDNIATYAGIALTTLTVLAGGIILIKKYVIV